jgi:hypothetical protein
MRRAVSVVLAAASMLGAALPALAGESLLIGRVERITLVPRGAPECPPSCPTTTPDGRPFVCVSNEGGCQQTRFRIEQVLLGDGKPGLADFDNGMNEWGQLVFPLERGPILVHLNGKRVRWSQLYQRDGKFRFSPEAFKRDVIKGVAPASIEADADGWAPLDLLLDRLDPNR